MFWQGLADFVVLLHCSFILFATAGGLLVLKWRRVLWWHLPAAAWGVLIELTGWICPLTPLEIALRQRGGADVYQGSFVERYVLPRLYPAEMTHELQRGLGLAVLVVNLAVYALVIFKQQRAVRRQHGAI